MTIEINKSSMKDKKNYCKKCRSFIFKSNKDGYIEFRDGLIISSNGIEFKVKCTCGEITTIKLK